MSSKKLFREGLVASMINQYEDLKETQANSCISMVFNAIKSEIGTENDSVTIKGFGKFYGKVNPDNDRLMIKFDDSN
jgi:nucleoid DNA-binding protein